MNYKKIIESNLFYIAVAILLGTLCILYAIAASEAYNNQEDNKERMRNAIEL